MRLSSEPYENSKCWQIIGIDFDWKIAALHPLLF